MKPLVCKLLRCTLLCVPTADARRQADGSASDRRGILEGKMNQSASTSKVGLPELLGMDLGQLCVAMRESKLRDGEGKEGGREGGREKEREREREQSKKERKRE